MILFTYNSSEIKFYKLSKPDIYSILFQDMSNFYKLINPSNPEISFMLLLGNSNYYKLLLKIGYLSYVFND